MNWCMSAMVCNTACQRHSDRLAASQQLHARLCSLQPCTQTKTHVANPPASPATCEWQGLLPAQHGAALVLLPIRPPSNCAQAIEQASYVCAPGVLQAYPYIQMQSQRKVSHSCVLLQADNAQSISSLLALSEHGLGHSGHNPGCTGCNCPVCLWLTTRRSLHCSADFSKCMTSLGRLQGQEILRPYESPCKVHRKQQQAEQ